MSKSFRLSLPIHFNLLLDLLRWIPICVSVGAMAGSASALLLVSLNFATQVRETHVWIIWLLAPAGFLVGLMYHLLGRSVEAGNNLILEEIHNPNATVPLRMTPLILIGTFLTHLFGGSAGREGTAVQTGASLADQLSRPLRINAEDRRILLMTGVSAGFGSVFGTPLAGAVFGIEVLSIGELTYRGLAPCLLASFAGDLLTRAWRVQHTVYRVTEIPALTISSIFSSIVAGIIFGLVAMGFAKATHFISRTLKKRIAYAPLRPIIGGAVVTLAVFSLHTTKYIGLGVPTIVASFQEKLPLYDWLAKFLFTVVTLGSGFKGGEVTPLFFIGSTLGNALSHLLPLPSTLLAGMGFAAVFAGAANTPSLPRSWLRSFLVRRREPSLESLASSATCAPDMAAFTTRSAWASASIGCGIFPEENHSPRSTASRQSRSQSRLRLRTTSPRVRLRRRFHISLRETSARAEEVA